MRMTLNMFMIVVATEMFPRRVASVLQDGRETTGSIADQLEKHPQTIRDRLKWLREWGYVRHHHESTGENCTTVLTTMHHRGVIENEPF